NPAKFAVVQTARSAPLPFTQSVRVGRPRKSISVVFALVLPPPQLQIVRSAPRRRDRATSSTSACVDCCSITLICSPRSLYIGCPHQYPIVSGIVRNQRSVASGQWSVTSGQWPERLRRERAEGRLMRTVHAALPAACRLLVTDH